MERDLVRLNVVINAVNGSFEEKLLIQSYYIKDTISLDQVH